MSSQRSIFDLGLGSTEKALTASVPSVRVSSSISHRFQMSHAISIIYIYWATKLKRLVTVAFKAAASAKLQLTRKAGPSPTLR